MKGFRAMKKAKKNWMKQKQIRYNDDDDDIEREKEKKIDNRSIHYPLVHL